MKTIFGCGLVCAAMAAAAMAQQEVPEAKLKAVFPEATGFKPQVKTLEEAKREPIEKALGRKLTEADLKPTFYVAMQGGKPAGVAYLGKSGEGNMEFAVGISTEGGRIVAVKVFAPADSPLAAEAFLKQFAGRTAVTEAAPVSADQRALIAFLLKQHELMDKAKKPQEAVEEKIDEQKGQLAAEAAIIEQVSVEYEKYLNTLDPAVLGTEGHARFVEWAKKSTAASQKFHQQVKAHPGDWAQLKKDYSALDDECENCHGGHKKKMRDQRKQLVAGGGSELVVGKDIQAPAGQEARAQALATEVKKAVLLGKGVFNIK